MKHNKVLRTILVLISLLFLVFLCWSIYKYTKIALLVIGVVVGILIVSGIVFMRVVLADSEKTTAIRNSYLSQLRSTDEDLRIKGAQSLLEMKAIETIDDLAEAIHIEKNVRIRKVLLETLYAMSELYRKIEGPRDQEKGSGPPVLTLDLPTYKTVLEKYVVPPLREALYSEDQDEKETAVMALLWIGTESALDAIEESGVSISVPEIKSQDQKEIQFTAYYPAEFHKLGKNSVYVYAYIMEMLKYVHGDIIKSKNEFGNNVPISKTAKQTINLINNIPITVVCESESSFFESQSVTTNWNGEWVRFAFYFDLNEQQPIRENEELSFRVSVRIHSIEIAYIEFEVRLSEQAQKIARPNPLAVAKYCSSTFLPYQKIFVSYSRKDDKVVGMYRNVQQAVGNDVFVDTYSIRAGENWEAALANAIDTADIFQLFWSQNSAQSASVKDEWDYALRYRCPKDRCENFIRPVFWTFPIPAEPPEELKHLNFKYIPLLDEK